jgi:hypothetical protein
MTANGDRYYRDDQLREIARRLKKASIDADLTPGGELHCELELYAALFRQRHVHGIAALLHYLTGLPKSNIASIKRSAGSFPQRPCTIWKNSPARKDSGQCHRLKSRRPKRAPGRLAPTASPGRQSAISLAVSTRGDGLPTNSKNPTAIALIS